ncbi:hypothetical protein PV04_02019 [Phialophora macrospora]|uniref:Uncharacterized protein n=1 Tax=Phialophora macrospora TaxID=1851006 RepID=A0A0D2FZL1_9EURO|nr:hypothetical protein PV04_02019 [Phialophora macrospora]
MVTQVIETGASPAPRRAKSPWGKMAYIVGLGCCMDERRPRPTSPPASRSPLEEIKTGDVNWSTSTLGIETDLNLRSGAIRSDLSIPLSSMEFYAPSLAPPPPAARPQSRPRRERRQGVESPVVTITDHDIATGTTPTIGECQREREERRQNRDSDRDGDKGRSRERVSTAQAWSQIDPLYGAYQPDRVQRTQRERQTQSRSRYSDIRAFDFMSYGGWIVI